MIVANQQNPKLTLNLICEVLSYLEPGQLFKDGAIRLNKKISQQQYLIRQVTIRHLGLLEDYSLEKSYIESVTGQKFDTTTATTNYGENANCYQFLHKYRRPHSHRIMLFGFQSVGGSCEEISEFKENYNMVTE